MLDMLETTVITYGEGHCPRGDSEDQLVPLLLKKMVSPSVAPTP